MDKKYVVYQHVTPDGLYYFGATQNVERRWSNNGAGYKGTALQPYIEKFGWNNIQHIVLFRDQTRENALWIEDFLITTAQEDGVCINQRRSGLVSKEEGYARDRNQKYYEQNKDKKQQYYEQNKEQIREQNKQYYEQNKQQILEQQKQYYEQNKQQILDKKQQYYEENKDKKKQYYEENKQQRREYQRQYYQRKKEEQQFKELGNLPLW